MFRRCRSPGAARSVLAAERASWRACTAVAMAAREVIRMPGPSFFMGNFLCHESAKERKHERKQKELSTDIQASILEESVFGLLTEYVLVCLLRAFALS